MMQQKRTRLALAEKAGIWRRWKAGQSLHAIGRAFGCKQVLHRPSELAAVTGKVKYWEPLPDI